MIPNREGTTDSLFERMEASSVRSRQGGSIHSLRQSIRQNLRNILNTRSGSRRGVPELGIDEPEGAENFRESTSRAIEQCIERYEPRISHAEVQAVISSASSPLGMVFHITAWVTFNETYEVLEFDMALNDSQHYQMDWQMEFEERYFREELDYLCRLSKPLTAEKSHLARFLAEEDADPGTERLLEGAIFLTGGLRQKIEDEFPELTHGLIKMLWPNYLRPVPAMTLIGYTPDMGKFSVSVLIPHNKQFITNTEEIRVDEMLSSDTRKKEPPPCTFTLCRDIWLLPVRLEQIENRNTTRNGVINVAFSVAPGMDFRTLDLNELRFWLGNDDNYIRDQLYLWFCEYLQGAGPTVGEQHTRLPEFMLKAIGFEPQDAMLPWPKNVHNGHRILQEYFCYPDTFLLFDLCGCPALPNRLQAEFSALQLRFSRPLSMDIQLRRDSPCLYCAPAINLFIRHAEAITLDNRRAGYPLVPSRHYPQHYDVFSVSSMVSQVQDMFREKDLGRPISAQAARQWLASESFSHQMEYSWKREVVYWHHRTKTSLFHHSFDHTLAFIHADDSYPSDESLLSDEVVSVSLTYTNRELLSQIRSSDIIGTTGKNATVASFRSIARPTQPLWPIVDNSLHWPLLSTINLNYLSLLGTNTLKQVIANFDRYAIHRPQTVRLSQQKLGIIERLETRPVDRLSTDIPTRGLTSTLYLHPGPFVCEGETYLLDTVFSHFLSLYASVSSFHMLTVVNTESQETRKWTERIGQHPLI